MNITDIGEGDSDSLICVTNNTDCCKDHMGEWYFPNGSAVKIEGAGEAFYRNRGQGVVHLHRRHNAMMPIGPFCCVVPEINQIACIIIEAKATVPYTNQVTTVMESTRGTTIIWWNPLVCMHVKSILIMVAISYQYEDNITRSWNDIVTDSTTHLFQLRLFEIQNCLEWVVSYFLIVYEPLNQLTIANIIPVILYRMRMLSPKLKIS